MNRNDEDEDGEAGEELTPEELALFGGPTPHGNGTGDSAVSQAERDAKRAAHAAERARLKAGGQLTHDGEEIAILSVGDGWRAFLLSDPRGKVGDGDTPGAALADLKRKLG